jgi:hypothetical protein
VCGSNTLAELKDHIYCVHDHILDGPRRPSACFFIENSFYSDRRNPNSISYAAPINEWIMRKSLERDQTLFDTKDPMSSSNFQSTPISLAESSIAKAFPYVPNSNSPSSSSPFLGLSTSAGNCYPEHEMASTRFSDLSIRLGSHYLYQHQGDCCHTIIVNEVRLLHATDFPYREAYPIRIYWNKSRKKICRVCELHSATYITYDDKLAGENPCYFW